MTQTKKTPAQLRAEAKALEAKARALEYKADAPKRRAEKKRQDAVEKVRKDFAKNLKSMEDLPNALKAYAKERFNLDVEWVNISGVYFTDKVRDRWREGSSREPVFSCQLEFANPADKRTGKWPKGSKPPHGESQDWSFDGFKIFCGDSFGYGPYGLSHGSGSGNGKSYHMSMTLYINDFPHIKAQMEAVLAEKKAEAEWNVRRQDEIRKASEYAEAQPDVVELKAQIQSLQHKLTEARAEHFNSVFKPEKPLVHKNAKHWHLYNK